MINDLEFSINLRVTELKGLRVFPLLQLDEDDQWCLESIHLTMDGAVQRKNKLAINSKFNNEDIDRYLEIIEQKLQI